MKITFYETQDWEEQYLREKLSGHDLAFYAGPLDSDTPPDNSTQIISMFVGSRITPSMLNALPELQCIATRTTGFDHIDVMACQARGIAVSNVPVYGANTVAEFTFALILTLSRKMYESVRRVREQGWFNVEDLRGFDLAGKTLGVVGTGHIGACVIQIAKGFGMSVVAYDPNTNPELSRKFKVKYVALDELLGVADVVTLHAPYSSATHHMLNSKNMKLIKPGAILINTARGALVETEALVEALHSGRLAGAGLDVLEEEGHIKDETEFLVNGHPKAEELKTLLADHALIDMDNVIITPHNAFHTVEAMKRILDTTVENIQGFINGTPQNVIK